MLMPLMMLIFHAFDYFSVSAYYFSRYTPFRQLIIAFLFI